MAKQYESLRVVNIPGDAGWTGIHEAYQEALDLQGLLEKFWSPTMTVTEQMLERGLEDTLYTMEQYFKERRDFTDLSAKRMQTLANQRAMLVILLLTLVACLYLTPVVFCVLSISSSAPGALTGLFVMGVVTTSVIVFCAALSLHKRLRALRAVETPVAVDVPELYEEGARVILLRHWLDAVFAPASEWAYDLKDKPHKRFDHKGLEGELRLIAALNELDLPELELPGPEFAIVLHGLLLDQSLDGDVILICSRGIFLLECKHWKDFIQVKDGSWTHKIKASHPDAVNGWLTREEADPLEQYSREKKELVRILKTALPNMSTGDLEALLDGGVVFTHPKGDLHLQDDLAATCGDVDFWFERIQARPAIPEFTFAEQLRVVQALLDHAASLREYPEGMHSASEQLAQSMEWELERLPDHNFIEDFALPYIEELGELRARIELERLRLAELAPQIGRAEPVHAGPQKNLNFSYRRYSV